MEAQRQVFLKSAADGSAKARTKAGSDKVAAATRDPQRGHTPGHFMQPEPLWKPHLHSPHPAPDPHDQPPPVKSLLFLKRC